MSQLKWVIAYDVSKNSSRNKISRRLEQLGFRKQFSVFEGELSPQEIGVLFQELASLLDFSTDCLTAWPTTENAHAKLMHAGKKRAVTKRDWNII